MHHLLRKTFRRITVGLTSAAIVVSSVGVATVATAPAASAQALRAGAASMNVPAAAPDEVQVRRGGPKRGPVVRGPARGPGYVARGPVRGPGYGRPGYGRPGWQGPRPGYHARWGRPYWRNGGWYYRNNNGAWIAAGIAGLAIGAAAGAAAANANSGSDAVAYCAQRFRSYNPATGTYTGYDGLQHPCP